VLNSTYFILGFAEALGRSLLTVVDVLNNARSVPPADAFLGAGEITAVRSVSNPSLPGLVTAGNADATGL
jgi:hypothetical protein